MNELEKELALPLVVPYNSEPSHDLPEGIMNCECIKSEELEKELALPLVVPYNSEPCHDLPEDIMNCESI